MKHLAPTPPAPAKPSRTAPGGPGSPAPQTGPPAPPNEEKFPAGRPAVGVQSRHTAFTKLLQLVYINPPSPPVWPAVPVHIVFVPPAPPFNRVRGMHDSD